MSIRYQEAITWISINEFSGELDPEKLGASASVRMLAGVMRVPIKKIVDDVTRLRIVIGQNKFVLSFIEHYLAKHGVPPTLLEIGTAAGGWSTGKTGGIVARLIRARALKRTVLHQPRALELA